MLEAYESGANGYPERLLGRIVYWPIRGRGGQGLAEKASRFAWPCGWDASQTSWELTQRDPVIGEVSTLIAAKRSGDSTWEDLEGAMMASIRGIGKGAMSFRSDSEESYRSDLEQQVAEFLAKREREQMLGSSRRKGIAKRRGGPAL